LGCIKAVSINHIKTKFSEEYTWTILSGYASIEAIVVQPDGKILAAGNTEGISLPFVARLMPDGTLDAAFANGGVFADMVFCGFYGVSAMALQPDGKLLVTGGIIDGMDWIPFVGSMIFRLHANGSIDESFGKGGKIAEKESWMSDYIGAYNNEAIAVQPNGKIVTAGYQYGGHSYCYNYVVSRYLANGTPDATFGNGGMVITEDESSVDECVKNILLQPDGKIVLGCYSKAKQDANNMTALRYTANGVLDHSFAPVARPMFHLKVQQKQAAGHFCSPTARLF
jgi:uncharacterized delta-60 repeat protein